jgi:glycosyltransferase involved in cell wall biosynthesis
LSVGLARKGFKVFVSCESSFFRLHPYSTYKNVNLVFFPIINSVRVLGEFIYDTLAIIWASLKVDIIYMLGYASVTSLIIPKLLGKVVIVNVDGLEWKRRKFHPILQFILKGFEKITTRIANYIVVDSINIGDYYKKTYNINPIYIPNGVKKIDPFPSVSDKFNLKDGEYYLVVARLEPENNIDLIIKGFIESKSSKKLIIVGGTKKTDYIKDLFKLTRNEENILFVGGIYDKKILMTLRFYCFAYIHGHEVGGTNPSLLEALSNRNVTLAYDVSYNREVAKDSAFYFKTSGDLAASIYKLENSPELYEQMKNYAFSNYLENYEVSNMVVSFERLLEIIIK